MISDRRGPPDRSTIPRYHPYLLINFYDDLSNERGISYVSQAFGGYLGFPEATRDR